MSNDAARVVSRERGARRPARTKNKNAKLPWSKSGSLSHDVCARCSPPRARATRGRRRESRVSLSVFSREVRFAPHPKPGEGSGVHGIGETTLGEKKKGLPSPVPLWVQDLHFDFLDWLCPPLPRCACCCTPPGRGPRRRHCGPPAATSWWLDARRGHLRCVLRVTL
jgi:hypothetical protein